ncbi:Uma2 family endonuclease [Synechococcus sp. Nb3U1]|uniref:Uma2 family endonuclease n=1 Tax=Synechococcus sp. Nb3U1 TaxID=1914529 RepID=UPI001F262B9D|nr:Uma2 family endonuclease [Synechococcus sp. Nb3U1]MCF2969658.1 Uma2 family endonuclease [Synechococcus sp. Nb3U1]
MVTTTDPLTTEKKLTVAEFLALPEGDITYELVDGKAVPKDKPMSPQRFHASLQKRLLMIIDAWCQGKGDVYTELAIRLHHQQQDWFPVPDLTYISFERWPEQLTTDGLCPVPPELVVEIISPSQSFGSMSQKATDYLDAGIPRVWIVDAAAKSITVYYPDAPPRTFMGSQVLEDDLLPGLAIIPQDVFAQARIP